MPNLSSRITTDVGKCGGRPCIRGLRVRVTDVLDLFAAGLTADQILGELPYLEADDLKACLQYAARTAGATILTKDRDFPDLAQRRGSPPCIIWITCGNT